MPFVPSETLLKLCKEVPPVFSYHYYNGISERGAVMGGHWPADAALTEEYLAVADNACKGYRALRDTYIPGAPMWVTESGDAGCGGNTWASTYLDVLRTLNELGTFAVNTDGVIFHNTLASSDYGLLQHGSFSPRPNYFAVLLWNHLMGTTVYDSHEAIREGAHVFAHSRRDGKEGVAYLILNNSTTDTTTVTLPCAAERYTLSADSLRADTMLLNGQPLVLDENDRLPALTPVQAKAGTLELAPATATFLVL
jgi:hypothetical protein